MCQDDLPARDQPAVAMATQQILAITDDHIFLCFETTSEHQEVRENLELPGVGCRLDFDIGDEMRSTRWGLLSPGGSGFQALYPHAQSHLGVVHVGQFVTPGDFSALKLDLATGYRMTFVTESGGSNRHPVLQVVRQKIEPVSVSALVKKPCFKIKE